MKTYISVMAPKTNVFVIENYINKSESEEYDSDISEDNGLRQD